MKLSWITKFALAFGLRKTETFLAAQPDLDADAHHDAIALAETLGSKTVRTALLAAGCDLLKVVDAIRHGHATADDLATHASILLAAGALIFFRHAIAKRPEVVSRMVDVVKTPLLVALMLSATLAFGQAANSQGPIANSQGAIANSQGPGSNTIAATTSSNTPTLQDSNLPSAISQLPSSPSISLNAAVAADLIEMLPGWQNVENFSDFAKAFGTNVALNAVYSWSSKGGLSSGGAAVAAPLVKVNWQLDPATVWALYGGPSLVVGSDKDGAFSAPFVPREIGSLIEVLDATGALVRRAVLGVGVSSWTYTAADQSADAAQHLAWATTPASFKLRLSSLWDGYASSACQEILVRT